MLIANCLMQVVRYSKYTGVSREIKGVTRSPLSWEYTVLFAMSDVIDVFSIRKRYVIQSHSL